MSDPLKNWSPYAREYDPLKAGSIDGTDTEPHDRAINRAINARYEPPRHLKSDASKTLFIARFGPRIREQELIKLCSTIGSVKSCNIIVDVVTGHSQGYGFVELSSSDEVRRAVKYLNGTNLDGSKIFVDYECSRTMKGWKPRRLGGGIGGKKESGQLRFGGRDRPFKRPIIPNIVIRSNY